MTIIFPGGTKTKSRLRRCVDNFLDRECGAATVDYVAVAVVFAGFGVAIAANIESGAANLGETMQSNATESSITLIGAPVDEGEEYEVY